MTMAMAVKYPGSMQFCSLASATVFHSHDSDVGVKHHGSTNVCHMASTVYEYIEVTALAILRSILAVRTVYHVGICKGRERF